MEKWKIQQKDLLNTFNLDDLNFETTNDLSRRKYENNFFYESGLKK